MFTPPLGFRLELDDRGQPVLVETPRTEVQVDEPTLPEPSVRPDDVSVEEWARRGDAVRDAAREFETLSGQDLRERFKGLTKHELDEEEIAALQADVRAHQLDDLVDALDHLERGKLRGRRTVRVVMPRGYLRKTLNALTPDELANLQERLQARGWTDEQVEGRLKTKIETKTLPKVTSPE